MCVHQTVTEEKFSILFQSQFSVGGGELVFQVWVSLVMVFNNMNVIFLYNKNENIYLAYAELRSHCIFISSVKHL